MSQAHKLIFVYWCVCFSLYVFKFSCLSTEHGNWSEWSVWTYCSKSCGGGLNIRYRKCDNPEPFNGGDDCKENWNDTKSCNLDRCSGKCSVHA